MQGPSMSLGDHDTDSDPDPDPSPVPIGMSTIDIGYQSFHRPLQH